LVWEIEIKIISVYVFLNNFYFTWGKNTLVRSFSRPEKLLLKIHTGSSGTIYSYWVEKALLFPNWSSFSRLKKKSGIFCRVRMFLIFVDFLSIMREEGQFEA
jgi:hypothetical protein